MRPEFSRGAGRYALLHQIPYFTNSVQKDKKMKIRTLLLIALVVALAGAMMHVGAVQADGLEGTPSNDFATNCQGYLGPLRSQIAQGNFAGFGPFGEHFTGQVNPGAHIGTVGEEAFLDALGVDTSCNP
jgi:hypothetical protein